MEVVRRITNKIPYRIKRGKERGVNIYPHFAGVLAAAGLNPLCHYINKRRITIAKTIRDQPILLECRRA